MSITLLLLLYVDGLSCVMSLRFSLELSLIKEIHCPTETGALNSQENIDIVFLILITQQAKLT